MKSPVDPAVCSQYFRWVKLNLLIVIECFIIWLLSFVECLSGI
jgi:hypothetical protein